MDRYTQAGNLLRNHGELSEKIAQIRQNIANKLIDKSAQLAMGRAAGTGDTIAPELLGSIMPDLRELQGFLGDVITQIEALQHD